MFTETQRSVLTLLDLTVRAVLDSGGMEPSLEQMKVWLAEIASVVAWEKRPVPPPPPTPPIQPNDDDDDDDTEVEDLP
jgi:hypothetical protein